MLRPHKCGRIISNSVYDPESGAKYRRRRLLRAVHSTDENSDPKLGKPDPFSKSEVDAAIREV